MCVYIFCCDYLVAVVVIIKIVVGGLFVNFPKTPVLNSHKLNNKPRAQTIKLTFPLISTLFLPDFW